MNVDKMLHNLIPRLELSNGASSAAVDGLYVHRVQTRPWT